MFLIFLHRQVHNNTIASAYFVVEGGKKKLKKNTVGLPTDESISGSIRQLKMIKTQKSLQIEISVSTNRPREYLLSTSKRALVALEKTSAWAFFIIETLRRIIVLIWKPIKQPTAKIKKPYPMLT